MAKAWKVKGVRPRNSFRWNARVILPIKVEEVYSWVESIRNPDNIEALHNMRISVKRLRYSMEFFGITYGEELTPFLKVVEELQQLLGGIHDCDVSQGVLTDYSRTFQAKAPPSLCEEGKSEPNPAEDYTACGDANIDAIGINALISHYHQRREAAYQRFLQKWDDLEQTDFKGQLLDIIAGNTQGVKE